MSKRPIQISLLAVLMAIVVFASVRLLGGQTTHKETAAPGTQPNAAAAKPLAFGILAGTRAVDRAGTDWASTFPAGCVVRPQAWQATSRRRCRFCITSRLPQCEHRNRVVFFVVRGN